MKKKLGSFPFGHFPAAWDVNNYYGCIFEHLRTYFRFFRSSIIKKGQFSYSHYNSVTQHFKFSQDIYSKLQSNKTILNKSPHFLSSRKYSCVTAYRNKSRLSFRQRLTELPCSWMLNLPQRHPIQFLMEVHPWTAVILFSPKYALK